MITRATLVSIVGASAVALAAPKNDAAPKQGAAPQKDTGPPMLPDDLPGPQPEVAKGAAKVEVPPIPEFALPIVEPGFHGPHELRVQGASVLDTEIKVKGYITWIYDCTAALAAVNPGATRTEIAAAIDKDPTLCDRPKFALGDTKRTSRDASIRVVDVPRPPTKAERGNRRPSELKGWWPEVPKLALGDHVVVTGTWALSSPHDEHATGGLLVYKALAHLPPTAAPAATSPVSPAAEPEITVTTKVPLRRLISNPVRNDSVDHANACNRANVARQYDTAIAECQAAIKAWEDNHLAWYMWSSAHMAKSEWQKARDAIEHAVTLRPDQAMYQLYYGIALYEAERERVRSEQAQRAHKKPEDVTLDPSELKLEAARDALRRAIKLDPDLWRAHYYLGQVYRDLDDIVREAEQFRATIATYPSYRFGYFALIELYRHWGHGDEALALAQLGLAHVPAAEAGDLWYEAGMAYDAKHDDARAIEAFGKAIAANPGDPGSKFQRGQIYFRRNDFANARRDLEDVAKSSDPRAADTRSLAIQMLNQMGKR